MEKSKGQGGVDIFSNIGQLWVQKVTLLFVKGWGVHYVVDKKENSIQT